MNQPTAPAQWYPDPSDAAKERYWDGDSWTDHKRMRLAVPAEATSDQLLPVGAAQIPSSVALTVTAPESRKGPTSAAPPQAEPVWANESKAHQEVPRLEYMPAIEVKPGVIHSYILSGVSLALTFAVPIFLISLVLAGFATWMAYSANQANNRGDLSAAYSKARAAGKLRVATYASWVAVGLVTLVAMLIGIAMLLDSAFY